jgi:hypothetical protein
MPQTSAEKKTQLTQLLKNVTSLKGTAGSESPNYVLFWTNEELLSLFAKSLTDDSTLGGMWPLVPSSTIILEFTLDGSTLNVSGFVNDKQVTLKGCNGQQSCDATSFASNLIASAKIADSASFCAS